MLRDSRAGSARRPAAIPPVERRTVTEEVLARVRDLLLRGTLRPGARIDQAELARAFGVSTVPIREALLRLQSAGLVEVVPHRGVFVSEVSVDELLDIYTTRELLEEQAARLAVERLDRADVETLDRVAAAMQTAANKHQLEELLRLNRDFHFTIYRAAGRRHLLQLIEQLWDLSARYAHLQLHAVPDRASEALYEIRSIVAACRRKDADALGWMIRYKVHQTTAGLLQHMTLPATSAEPAPASRQRRTEGAAGSNAKPAPKKAPSKKAAPRTVATKRPGSKASPKTSKTAAKAGAKKTTITASPAPRGRGRPAKTKGRNGA